MYADVGINFTTLTHLDDIGLITFNSLSSFKRLKLPQRVPILYYNTLLWLSMKKEQDNELELGKALLTKTGQQLAPICGSESVPGFADYLVKKWGEAGYAPHSSYPRLELGAMPK